MGLAEEPGGRETRERLREAVHNVAEIDIEGASLIYCKLAHQGAQNSVRGPSAAYYSCSAESTNRIG